MSVVAGVLPSTTPTPKSKKFSSVAITDGLEIQGTLVINALQTSADALTLHATASGTQTITDSAVLALQNVVFANVVGSAPAAWDTVGDINYTAPVTGIYAINSSITWETSGAGDRALSINIGGAGALTVNQPAIGAAIGTQQSVAGEFPVTAGQVIRIQAAQSSAGDLDITAGNLQIKLVRRTA